MMVKSKRDRFKALTFVRLSVKGWAFAPDEWLPGMVKQAEEQKSLLDVSLHAAADEIIQPLKDAIAKGSKS